MAETGVRETGSSIAQADLALTGMTCAACAARIERGLNSLDGVSASVNYATESARVTYDAGAVAPAALLAAVEAAGYGARLAADTTPELLDAEAAERVAALRARLWVAIGLGAPVMVLSMVPGAQFSGWPLVALALAAPVVTWAAWPFHRAALAGARHASTTMDTLISIGVVAATGWSVWAIGWGEALDAARHGAGHSGGASSHVYLEVAVAVTAFILAGRYFEARARRRAGDALRSLLALGARHATVLRDGAERTIDAALVRVGDVLVVRPGEVLAADGVVVEGASALDVSMLTGESVPAEVAEGSAVTGATVNLTGRLHVRATRVGADTTFARMARLVRDAQTTKAPVQRLADRVSSVFVPTVIVVAGATAAAWWLAGGDAARAFTAGVAVLIIACPCALGLATPTALMVGSGRAAQMGIVIKGVDVLQSTRRVDTVIFDKTGTVTTGSMQLVGVTCAAGTERADVLRLAGALEHASEHPVARAIATAARAECGALPPVADFASRPGRGTSGTVEGRGVLVGSEAMLGASALVPGDLRRALVAAREDGHTAVLVAWDGAARAVCAVADRPKAHAATAVAELKNLGLRPMLLTGDNRATALAIARQVGIEPDEQHVIAGVLPEEKVRVVADLQGRGYAVAMVGDGVNDAAALAQADVGVAMGTGTDVAMHASDLTIVSGDLRLVTSAILLSRRTLRTISTNVFWAFAYNTAAIPLAAAGLLNPMWASAAMAASSLFVVGNSLRLRRSPLTPHTAFVHATR
ncbi:MAG: heavy metal translocating P-type ATPase [Ilumatobacteraceae bacterium]